MTTGLTNSPLYTPLAICSLCMTFVHTRYILLTVLLLRLLEQNALYEDWRCKGADSWDMVSPAILTSLKRSRALGYPPDQAPNPFLSPVEIPCV